MLDHGVLYLMYKDKIEPMELVAIYTAQMIYAGYQTKQIFNDPKEKVNDGTNSNTTA